MESLTDLYASVFNTSVPEPINDVLLQSLHTERYQEALIHCYNTCDTTGRGDLECSSHPEFLVNVFKLLYCFTDVRFPVKLITELENKIAQECGRVYSFGAQLSVERVNIPENFCGVYKCKIVDFIDSMKKYSRYKFVYSPGNSDFYYFFDKKYLDRAVELITGV